MSCNLDKVEDFLSEWEDEIIAVYGENYTTDDVIEYMEDHDLYGQELFRYWLANQ